MVVGRRLVSMCPVLLNGRVVWDQQLFPRDECEERLAQVQSLLVDHHLDGLIVAGAKVGYEDLCYLTQFIPYAAWALAVVPAQGEMTLITGVGGGRELPASRARTWVSDVRNLKNLGPALNDLLRERGLVGPLGLVGLSSLPPALQRRLREGLASFTCAGADDLPGLARRSLRSREMSAVRRSAAIATAARQAVEAAHASGATNTAALLAGEREARRRGALDVRGLVNQTDDGELAPVESPDAYRSDPLVGYLAVNDLGYWADVAVTAGNPPPELMARATSALGRMRSAARPGTAVEALARAGQTEPGISQEHGFGNGLGLALYGWPAIEEKSSDVLVENLALALRVRLKQEGTPGVFVSDVVRVTAGGGVSLCR